MRRRRSDSTQFPALPGSLAALRGFLACCEGSKECGKVCASGVYEKGTVKSTKFMSAACKLGAAKLPRKANARTCASAAVLPRYLTRLFQQTVQFAVE